MRVARGLAALVTGPNRRCRLRSYWFRLQGFALSRRLYTDSEGVRYRLDLSDMAIDQSIYVNRRWADGRPFILDTIGGVGGRTVIEVGANIGMTTAALVVRDKAAHVIAFEPDPSNLARLHETLDLNGITEKVTVYPAAISDRTGTAALALSGTNTGDHIIGDIPGRATVQVEVLRLDDVHVDYEQVALAWIDVQGHEAHALAGADRLLSADIPVLVEYGPEWLRNSGGLEWLHEIIEARFTTVVDTWTRQTMPAQRVSDLAAVYEGDQHTDLLLLH